MAYFKEKPGDISMSENSEIERKNEECFEHRNHREFNHRESIALKFPNAIKKYHVRESNSFGSENLCAAAT